MSGKSSLPDFPVLPGDSNVVGARPAGDDRRNSRKYETELTVIDAHATVDTEKEHHGRGMSPRRDVGVAQ